MSQLQCARARALNHLFHISTAADAKIRAEVAALGTTQLKIGLGNWGYWEDAKSTRFRSPWRKWNRLTSAPLWRTGDKGAPPLSQTLAVRKQLQRKTEAPSSAPPQTQLSTVSAASPICSDFQTFCPDWLHFGHFLCFGGIAASQRSHRIFPIYF